MSRRAALRASAIGGAAGLSGLLGAAVRPVSAAGPTVQAGRATIWYQPNVQEVPYNATFITLCQDFIDRNFNAKNPGMDVKMWGQPGSDGAAQISLDIAGSGYADIVEGCCNDFALLQSGNWLLPLDPYLKAGNIPTSLWTAPHIGALTVGGHLYGLPSYEAPIAMAYRPDLLADAGVAVPDTDWTYDDAAKVWRSLAAEVKGQWRYGANLFWCSGFTDQVFDSWVRAFGTTELNPEHTRFIADNGAGVAFLNWMVGLIREKAVTTCQHGNPQELAQGQFVFSMQPTYTLFGQAAALGGVDFDYMPIPQGPYGRTYNSNIDFYGLNAATKYPEQAWEFLRWISVDPAWQRYQMQISLISPALLSLWDDWLAAIPNVAPIFRNKALYWYKEGVVNGWGYPQVTFKYEPSTLAGTVQEWLDQITYSLTVSPQLGLQQLARQVNAMEAAATGVVTAQSAAFKSVAAIQAGPTTSYSAPPMLGEGVPPSSAASWVVASPTGQYTLLGDGWDIYDATDNCVFACMPVTATEGEWSCRVTGFTNLTCESGGKPTMSVWAKVGIMARSDLSDDAVMVTPHVTGDNQIEYAVRVVSGSTPGGASGLAPLVNGQPVTLMKPLGTPQANYLIAPLWLKIQRKGLNWTPWASMDGVNWTQLFAPGGAEMGGCWVGIFATAHNGDFNDVGYIRAVVDHLSFTPTHLVQLGKLGTPPAAGPVPKDWATMPAAGL